MLGNSSSAFDARCSLKIFFMLSFRGEKFIAIYKKVSRNFYQRFYATVSCFNIGEYCEYTLIFAEPKANNCFSINFQI